METEGGAVSNLQRILVPEMNLLKDLRRDVKQCLGSQNQYHHG
jgi:hypothetical protein